MKIGELVYHNPVFLFSWLRLRARYNCDRSYCKIPDFTLPKLGIIPDFVLRKHVIFPKNFVCA